MSKYTAERYIRAQGRDYWAVIADDSPVSRMNSLTEAEASIIAFALNTVAEGYLLAKDWGHKDIFDPTKMEYYDGPTEGVAP